MYIEELEGLIKTVFNITNYQDINNKTIEFLLNHKNNNINYTSPILNIIFLCIGVIGNIICIYVFSTRKMRAIKFNLYLLVFSIFELFFCLILFPDYLFKLIHRDNLFLHQLNKYFTIAFDYFVHSVDSYLAVVRLTLSIDRLYAIRKPLEIKNFFTNLHAKRLIITIFFIIFGLHIPAIILCHHHGDKFIFVSYCSLISPLIFNIIPAIIVLILNLKLSKEIIKFSKNVLEENNQNLCNSTYSKSGSLVNTSVNFNTRGNSVVMRRFSVKPVKKVPKSIYVLIVILSLWFVVCTIPYYTLNTHNIIIFFSVFDINVNILEINEKLKKIEKLQSISSIFFNSTHCINCFFYIFINSDFRNILKNIKFFRR
jgi:hypothetical protein